ncbi:MAG: phenylacetate--CoA ligase family protein [Caldimonas sp.]
MPTTRAPMVAAAVHTVQPPFDPWRSTTVAADVAMARHASDAALAERRQRRLAALISSAIDGSALYRSLLRGAGPDTGLQDMPIVRKAELMLRFDEWCTDPAIRIDALHRFVADPANIARPFLDRYVVWESSGSTGQPGLFVQDAAAMAVYDALEALRKPDLAPLGRLLDPWGLAERIVFVGAVGGHFASTVSIERLRLLNPLLARQISSVSFLQPLERLVAEVQERRPTVLTTYPSVAVLLADESLAGRLSISPREVWTGGETLSAAMRLHIQDAFGCRVVNSYGASEFLSLACECSRGSLHLNTDWVVLEPVDADGRAVPAGSVGTTTLLTNLANHVQPLIRYDIGDQVSLRTGSCACGSALPVIAVSGRSDDTLRLDGRAGGAIDVLPLALSTVLEDRAGLFDFQLDQNDRGELTLSTAQHGAEATGLLQRAQGELAAFLHELGAADARIRCCTGRPPRRGRSGKLQRIIASARH